MYTKYMEKRKGEVISTKGDLTWSWIIWRLRGCNLAKPPTGLFPLRSHVEISIALIIAWQGFD